MSSGVVRSRVTLSRTAMFCLLRAVSDDLELMVRENQQLSDQLVSAQESAEKLTEQQASAQETIANLEQLSRVKENDLEDLRQAYEVYTSTSLSTSNDQTLWFSGRGQ